MNFRLRVLAAALLLAVVASGAVFGAPSAFAQVQTQTETPLQTLSAFARFFGRDVPAEALQRAAAQPVSTSQWHQTLEAAKTAKLPFVARRVSLAELRRSGDIALVRLQSPESVAIIQAIGAQNALVYQNGGDALMPNAQLARRFRGEALLLSEENAAAAPRLRIGEPVRVATISSLGGDSELVENVLLENLGNAPLALSVASTSCGCTGATVTPLIPPRQSGKLTMRMHAEGSRLVTVNLKSNDPRRAWAVVAMQSQMPKTVITPPQAISASTRIGESLTQRVDFSLPSGVSVESVASGQSFVDARLAAPQTLEVTVAKEAPPGAWNDRVVLKLRGGDVRQIIVPIGGYVSDDVVAEPSLLALGNVPADAEVRKVVVVSGPASRPFSIASIQSSERVTAKASSEVVASSHAVEVTIRAGSELGAAIQERVTLTFSDKRMLDIDVFGTVAASTRAFSAALQPGQMAPDFDVPDMNGAPQSLSNRRGKRNLLLTFFPRCFTGGCANHLSSLRDVKAQLDAADTDVLAVSVDAAQGEQGQKAFAAAWQLNFPLIPDASRKLSLLYGAAQRPDDLASRMTVLIDKNGVIRWIDRDVQVKTHGTDVLAKMRELRMMK